jgi:hypothetical protein
MLQINVLAHTIDRQNFLSKSLDFLKKINNKDKIKIVIGFTTNNLFWENKKQELETSGLKIEIFQNNSYMGKINSFINSEYEFSCSMDEDIVLNEFLWDYIIDNLSILHDENNLILIPLLSNGIPTTETFIEDFCTEKEKDEFFQIFKNTKMIYHHMVGHNNLDYSFLDNWDETFIERLFKIEHHYRGIHPIRISYDANFKLAEIICKTNKLWIPNDYYLEIKQYPYFCNSFFIIKTKTWSKIIKDNTLYRDQFDEVPLNLYMRNTKTNIVVIRNGFCVHMCYNTVNIDNPNNQKNLERYYYDKLFKT